MKLLIQYFISICLILLCTLAFSQTEITNENGQKINVEDYLQRAEQQIQLGDKKEATRYLNDLAATYWENKNYSRAIELYQRSIKLNSEVNNESGISAIYSNLGMIYADQKDYPSSYEYFKKSIELRKKLKEKSLLITTHINISVVLNNLKRFDESSQNLQEALTLALELKDKQLIRSCYGLLSETYEKAGNSVEMLKYFKLYSTFTDMVETESTEKNMELLREMQLKNQLTEAEKKNQELELLFKSRELYEKEKEITGIDTSYRSLLKKYTRNELILQIAQKDRKIKGLDLVREQEKLKQNTIILTIVVIALILICLFLIFIYREYRHKKKSNVLLRQQNEAINQQQQKILDQKNEIETSLNEISKKNNDITSSINYAKIIQQALLTDTETIRRIIPNSFVFFQPKDIVSGDFYLFKKIGNKTIFAAADCTGHGVPGAFVSMLGHNILENIITHVTTETDLILKALNKGVIKALHQTTSRAAQDGMDISICLIDQQRRILQFSGAGRPMICIKNNELNFIKGDTRAIGGIVREKEQRTYTKHEIAIDSTLHVYLFSDGYTDQFSEKTNKKFTVNRLKEKLLEIHQKPIHEQEILLKDNIAEWKGNTMQIDDMLIIGVVINEE